METDPKGQLGGLDTSEAVRRRLASESRAWRCSGCGGRTNEEIIRETEEAARAAEAEAEAAAGEGSSSSKPKDVQIPPELKLGFRDEMEKAAAGGAAAAAGAGAGASTEAIAQANEDAESAELAEGFVQTVPRAHLDISAGAAQPGQTVPQPTRTVPLPNAAHNTGGPPQQAPLQQRQTFNDDGGVPRWIDRVIAALVFCLVAMILKVLLAK